MFLPGESQGQGSLVGCCLWGHTESDTTEAAAAAAERLEVEVRKNNQVILYEMHVIGWS